MIHTDSTRSGATALSTYSSSAPSTERVVASSVDGALDGGVRREVMDA